MKIVKDYLVLVCTVFAFICGAYFSSAFAETGGSVNAAEIGESVIEESLQGIEQLSPYVLMYWTGERPSDDLAGKVEEKAAEKLKEAGIDVNPGEPNEAVIKVLERRIGETQGKLRWRSINLPELMIRVYVIKHQGSGTCVFNVQTSLARKVYTTQRPRRAMKAEVWRIDVGPSATGAENFETELAEAVLSQVDAFIEAYQKADRSVKKAGDLRKQKRYSVTKTTEKWESKEAAAETTENIYVASKNSRVFHKADCYAAKRISPKNLVRYKSRAEAIKDGKRPCKICKP